MWNELGEETPNQNIWGKKSIFKKRKITKIKKKPKYRAVKTAYIN